MEKNWSLKELYPSFDCEEFKADTARVKEQIKELRAFADERLNDYDNATLTIKDYINFQTDFGRRIMRICDYCELIMSTDADNRQALKHIEAAEETLTEMTLPETKFNIYIKNIDDGQLSEVIENDPLLKEHEFYLREIKRNGQYLLSEREEEIYAKMQTTGSSAWIKYEDNVISTLMVDITVNGEEKRLPFPAVRNMAYDRDRNVRKAAYEAELAACESISRACAAALNGIKGEVLTTVKLRGYESPLDMTLKDSRMDIDILNALISAMRNNLGMFEGYFKKKASILGLDILNFYDMFAPVTEREMRFTYEEAVDFVIKSFTEFSPKLGEYAKKAAESNWIDVMPKEGKRGGAFCQNMHYIKESRFLLNFDGTFNDVLTLAHELGHGYHGECLNEEAFLNSYYPMPIAETASTLCETIVINAALKSVGEEQAREILDNNISSCAQVIVDILSRFIFESNVFEMRKEGSLSADEFCEIMLNAQKEAYGGSLNHECLHKYMWVVKSHYYSASENFYNFPYAFGQLLSLGLYSIFKENGQDFVNTYDKLLAATGKADLRQVAQIAGIDLGSQEFWNKSFEYIKEEIERFTGNH